jgi:hypothetical protein
MKKLKFTTMPAIALYAMLAAGLYGCSNTDNHNGRYFYGNDGKLYKAEDAQCVNCYRLREVKDLDTAFVKVTKPCR